MAALQFLYIGDEPGRVRTVSKWNENDWYISGLDESGGGVRTFRKDRIVSFISDEDLLKPSFGEATPSSSKPPRTIDSRPDVPFSPIFLTGRSCNWPPATWILSTSGHQ